MGWFHVQKHYSTPHGKKQQKISTQRKRVLKIRMFYSASIYNRDLRICRPLLVRTEKAMRLSYFDSDMPQFCHIIRIG